MALALGAGGAGPTRRAVERVLMIGQKLAHYTILEKLGAGGMGVVYLARDEQLHRTVAIKVLPEGADDVTRARLLHEARAASALNSPHICTVYETGRGGGRSLHRDGVRPRAAAQLHRGEGGPAVRDGSPVWDPGRRGARPRARARDPPPGPQGVQRRGRRRRPGEGPRLRPREAPAGRARVGESTISQLSLTREGTVVGTLPCLAPEVLRGGDSTVRSDIWAFGVLLHELAGGELPFAGQTSFDLTSAILRDPPSPLPAHVPAGLRSVILRCLSKEPADRYGHAGEVRAALEALLSHSQVVSVTHAPSARGSGSGGAWRARSSARRAPRGSGMALVPSRHQAPPLVGGGRLALFISSEGRVFDPAISPDGKMVAYVAHPSEGGGTDLFVGRVAGGGHLRLTHDEAAEGNPAFSPDGERIAFARADRGGAPEICVVPALGGHAFCVAQSARNPTWSPDGSRVAFVRVTAGQPDSLATANVDGSDFRHVAGRRRWARIPEGRPPGPLTGPGSQWCGAPAESPARSGWCRPRAGRPRA